MRTTKSVPRPGSSPGVIITREPDVIGHSRSRDNLNRGRTINKRHKALHNNTRERIITQRPSSAYFPSSSLPSSLLPPPLSLSLSLSLSLNLSRSSAPDHRSSEEIPSVCDRAASGKTCRTTCSVKDYYKTWKTSRLEISRCI
jgi:hypothetical protein